MRDLKSPRTVLLTGADGQVGWEVRRIAPASTELVACNRAQLDITDGEAVMRTVARLQPDVVINAAAYTAVDRAESEPKLAYAVNSEGPANLARAAAQKGIRLIHVSTDFVFDGQSTRPYRPSDHPAPLNVYGASKLAGERQVLELAGHHSLVLRSSWLYSTHGQNFVKTMLKLMSAGTPLRVVSDQQGSPTWACNLARAIWQSIDTPDCNGITHFSDAGSTSWHGFASAIQQEALEAGLLQSAAEIVPIRTDEYPTAARRPAFSALAEDPLLLSTIRLTRRPWRSALRQMLGEWAASESR